MNDNDIIKAINDYKDLYNFNEIIPLSAYKNDNVNRLLEVLEKYLPDSILILGTSDNMVHKIAENLNLPKIEKIIYINEIATQEEMETARRIRIYQRFETKLFQAV